MTGFLPSKVSGAITQLMMALNGNTDKGQNLLLRKEETSASSSQQKDSSKDDLEERLKHVASAARLSRDS